MKRQIAKGLPSSKTFVRVCVCRQQVPKQQVVSKGRSIEFRNLVCCLEVAASFPLTLLRSTNTCQICTRKCVCLCAGDREKRMKTFKLLTHGAKIPSPHSSPSWGVRGCGSLGVCLKASLTAGQRRRFDVFVARLRASCPRSLTLSMTDQCEPAEWYRASKLQPIYHSRSESGLAMASLEQTHNAARDGETVCS